MKKKNIKKKRKVLTMCTILLMCMTAYFVNVIYSQQVHINSVNSEIALRKAKIEELKSSIESCNSYLEEKKNMTDEEYAEFIENYARSLGYVMPYEKEFEDVNK